MKKYLLSLMALAVGLSSCNNNLVEEVTSLSGNNDVITAKMEISDSRTAMSGSSVVWSANDAIGVFIGTANNQYNLKSGNGTITGDFESAGLQVSTAGVKEYAYFPYVATATISGGVISTTLPETYVYSENSNNNAVMAAKVGTESQSAISFKNAGALYAVTVENIPAGYNKAVLKYLNASDNVGIAGAATIMFGQDGTPTLAVADATDAASAKKTVTVTFTSSNEPTTKTFYFPMPVKATGYANQLQFSLESDNAGLEAKAAPVFTKEPARNKLYAVTLKLDVVSGSVVTETANAEAANEKLAEDEITSVSINQVAASDEITIPAKSEESAEKPHSIDLSNATLPASGSVSIVVEEATPSDAGKATVEELTVIVPEGTSASSLTIDAPGTTVTIQGEDGTVIEKIEATTAQNTLVIGKGVTVKNLDVKAGNVRVEEGGKIESIDNNTGGILYITNEGGTLPTDLSGKNIIVLSMTDGVCEVFSDEELEAALKQDKKEISIKLSADLSVDVTAWETLAFGGETTEVIKIDGDNHTLTFNQLNSDWNNIATKNGAKLVIMNAKITNSGHNNGPWNRHDLNFACDVELTDVTSDKAIALKAGGTLTRVAISDANTSDTYAIWIQPNGQTVTLEECTIDMIACTDGRGIKIDEQYVDTPAKVTLSVSKTTFKTEEKSAILVKSKAGADITLKEVDITNVAADSTNPVWVDGDAAGYADKVIVTGGNKIVEP